MNIVTDIREMRGIMVISAEGCAAIRIRKLHFAKAPLATGDEFDADEYVNAIAAIQFTDAYEAALTSLDFCARTAKEIERSLLNKGYVEPAVRAVVERLTENRLIDDKRLAGRMAESASAKAVGVYAMKRKLRAKGISEEDAEDALECFDDEQQQIACRRAAEKLLRKYEALPAREGRAKLSQALSRRGFSWDAIHSAVDALMQTDDYE